MIANKPDFAVASHSDASLDARRAAANRQEAFQEWHRLYVDPDVWTDPVKRSAMCRARLGYQDVTLRWFQACRESF
jgi:hypothetical protein